MSIRAKRVLKRYYRGPVCSTQTSFGLWFRFKPGFMHYNKCIVWYKFSHHGNHSNQNSLSVPFVLSAGPSSAFEKWSWDAEGVPRVPKVHEGESTRGGFPLS